LVIAWLGAAPLVPVFIVIGIGTRYGHIRQEPKPPSNQDQMKDLLFIGLS